MRAPSPNNDGMGSLLYADGTARFRVWAPNSSRVQLFGDFTGGSSMPSTSPLSLAPVTGPPTKFLSPKTTSTNTSSATPEASTTLPAPTTAPTPEPSRSRVPLLPPRATSSIRRSSPEPSALQHSGLPGLPHLPTPHWFVCRQERRNSRSPTTSPLSSMSSPSSTTSAAWVSMLLNYYRSRTFSATCLARALALAPTRATVPRTCLLPKTPTPRPRSAP